MNEIYKPIPEYETQYQVSNLGNVKSLAKNGKKDTILKQERNRSKSVFYRRVTLCKNGDIKRFQVHRLVALTFIPNPENKPQVNHIDNNTENNCIDNLEWCTGKENMEHSAKQGRQEGIQENATELAAIANRKAGQIKWEAYIGHNMNGRILHSIFREETKTKVIWKGNFECALCGDDIIASLDESLRKSKIQVVPCRSCALKKT